MKRAMRDNLTQTHDFRYGEFHLVIKKNINR